MISFAVKKALLRTFHFFSGKSMGFLLVLSEATNQSMEMRSHWYANNLFCLISKGNPHKNNKKEPSCSLFSPRILKWTKTYRINQTGKNKRDRGYSVCSLHQKEATLDQYKWNAFPKRSMINFFLFLFVSFVIFC